MLVLHVLLLLCKNWHRSARSMQKRVTFVHIDLGGVEVIGQRNGVLGGLVEHSHPDHLDSPAAPIL